VGGETYFGDLPVAIRIQLVTVGPLLLGGVCGFLLGETAAGWWIAQGVAALGGLAGGLDHPNARSAALRGLIGGTLFGVGVVLADAISSNSHMADTPHPIGLLIPVTALIGTLLAALGGRIRAGADA
jgi:hypothetical protein